MKIYPHINGPSSGHHEFCYVFLKYDGSNIRIEWSKKRGWYKFGTRRTLFDEQTPIYGQIVSLFLDKYANDLEKVFSKNKLFRNVRNITIFSEWFGAKSFAGNHKPDDKKDIIIFDVSPHKQGILGPKDFIDIFGHLAIAELVYQGSFSPWLIDAVKNEKINLLSKYKIESEIPEGVVCKGGKGHKLWMVKIKTKRYKSVLKEHFENNWQQYWE